MLSWCSDRLFRCSLCGYIYIYGGPTLESTKPPSTNPFLATPPSGNSSYSCPGRTTIATVLRPDTMSVRPWTPPSVPVRHPLAYHAALPDQGDASKTPGSPIQDEYEGLEMDPPDDYGDSGPSRSPKTGTPSFSPLTPVTPEASRRPPKPLPIEAWKGARTRCQGPRG